MSVLLLLRDGRRITAREMAQRLEVSTRTVMRDLDVLSSAGVPVYAVRGPEGGFELMDTFDQHVPQLPGGTAAGARIRRVRVRISPVALQRALVLGEPRGWRQRPVPDAPHPDRPDWIEGTFRFDSYDGAAQELLALGTQVEVLLPEDLRAAMAQHGRRIAQLHER